MKQATILITETKLYQSVRKKTCFICFLRILLQLAPIKQYGYYRFFKKFFPSVDIL